LSKIFDRCGLGLNRFHGFGRLNAKARRGGRACLDFLLTP
jgi:hypothetical protein